MSSLYTHFGLLFTVYLGEGAALFMPKGTTAYSREDRAMIRESMKAECLGANIENEAAVKVWRDEQLHTFDSMAADKNCLKLAEGDGHSWGGKSLLHILAEDGEVDFLEILLKRGMNPNLRDVHYDTPITIARKNGNEPCVKKLLEHGAHEFPGNLSDYFMGRIVDGKLKC